MQSCDDAGSAYTGLAPRSDLSDLLKIFGRDPIEVEEYINQYVSEELGKDCL